MKRPSLNELADTDLQLARALERHRAEETFRPTVAGDSNLPKTRTISPEAADAINKATLG